MKSTAIDFQFYFESNWIWVNRSLSSKKIHSNYDSHTNNGIIYQYWFLSSIFSPNSFWNRECVIAQIANGMEERLFRNSFSYSCSQWNSLCNWLLWLEINFKWKSRNKNWAHIQVVFSSDQRSQSIWCYNVKFTQKSKIKWGIPSRLRFISIHLKKREEKIR